MNNAKRIQRTPRAKGTLELTVDNLMITGDGKDQDDEKLPHCSFAKVYGRICVVSSNSEGRILGFGDKGEHFTFTVERRSDNQRYREKFGNRVRS